MVKLPAHILIPSANRKLKTHLLKSHVCTQKLPSGAFWSITPEVYASSPEFTFVQMANYLSLPELIALGYEYCGTYAIDPCEGIASFDLPPLTNARKLKRFVDAMPPVRGLEKARIAVKYVHDNSASPMETVLHIVFILPGPMGGYHLQIPILNHKIQLNERASKVYHHQFCRCDLFFPEIGLDVEYNGVEYHRYKADDDAARENALAIMGFRLTTITKSQFYDPESLGEIARYIAKLYGKEKRSCDVAWTQARQQLHASLRMYLNAQNRKPR